MLTRQPKIADFPLPVGCPEHVGGLRIAVEDSGVTDVSEATADLAHYLDDLDLLALELRDTIMEIALGKGHGIPDLIVV